MDLLDLIVRNDTAFCDVHAALATEELHAHESGSRGLLGEAQLNDRLRSRNVASATLGYGLARRRKRE
jgi:hypothetical protein